MGDFQPPNYDYWISRYKEGQIGWAYTNIAIIWLLWFTQIMIVVICMLNFLIAIVSDSYGWIIENEKAQRIEQQEFQNTKSLNEGYQLNEAFDVIYMYTDLSNGKSNEWDSTSRIINKSINDLELKQSKRHTEVEKMLDKFSESINSLITKLSNQTSHIKETADANRPSIGPDNS